MELASSISTLVVSAATISAGCHVAMYIYVQMRRAAQLI